MAYVSPTLVIVPLPSGGRALYDIQPQHMPRADVAESLRWPVEFGFQVAHELHGVWYEPGGPMRHAWHEITDARTLALINRCPEFTAADVAPMVQA